MNILIYATIGILGMCVYQIAEGTFTFEKCCRYMWNWIFTSFVLFIFWFLTGQLSAFCDNCPYAGSKKQDLLLEIYRAESHNSQIYFHRVKDIEKKYAITGEDVFITTITTGIMAIPASDFRSKAIAIVLANAAQYFHKEYCSHRAVAYLMRKYHWSFYYQEKCKTEILRNKTMCKDCEYKYFLMYFKDDSSYMPKIILPEDCELDPCLYEETGEECYFSKVVTRKKQSCLT